MVIFHIFLFEGFTNLVANRMAWCGHETGLFPCWFLHLRFPTLLPHLNLPHPPTIQYPFCKPTSPGNLARRASVCQLNLHLAQVCFLSMCSSIFCSPLPQFWSNTSAQSDHFLSPVSILHLLTGTTCEGSSKVQVSRSTALLSNSSGNC